MAHGKITLHIDFDQDVIKRYIEEGVLTLSAALALALNQTLSKVNGMEEVKLHEVSTYEVDIEYNLEDTARGIPEVKPEGRVELLFAND